MTSQFSSQTFLSLLRSKGLTLGQPFTVLAQTVSTNDDALAALKSGANVGTLFIAESQSGGRGRHGRHWHSVAGESLTFSVIARPRVSTERLSVVTLATGLAVKDALTEHGATELTLKWPNDVLHRDKKLVGILVEKPSTLDPQDTSIVIGVGVNLGASSVPKELAAQATALEQVVPNLPSREHLLVSMLVQLERRLLQLERDSSSLITDIRACDALLGREIDVEGRRGKACGIAEGGELLVDFAGRVQGVTSGTVLLVH